MKTEIIIGSVCAFEHLLSKQRLIRAQSSIDLVLFAVSFLGIAVSAVAAALWWALKAYLKLGENNHE